MSWLSLVSNQLWTLPARWPGTANAPTLWSFDANGFASPSKLPGSSQPRPITEGERQQMNQYNNERLQLNAANRAAVDAIISRFTPVGDIDYHHLSDAAASQLTHDAMWLADHQQGSDFYNDPYNYIGLPGTDFDYQADFLFVRFEKLVQEACLAVDYSEVNAKVNAGVSTPIVIDLGGDGIETTSFLAGSQVMFDITGDGNKDCTAWLNGNDAFLAIDKNGNGKIDGINELFGGANRADGFAKLIEFDSNDDGKVDSKDDRFSELLLWQDKNIDGTTDSGELSSASQSGLESISTNYLTQNLTNNGNLLGEASQAVYQGHETTAVDVYFRFSEIEKTVVQGGLDIHPLIAEMAKFSASPSNTLNHTYAGEFQKNWEFAAVESKYFA